MGRAKKSRKIRAQHKSVRRSEIFLKKVERCNRRPLPDVSFSIPGAPGRASVSMAYAGER